MPTERIIGSLSGIQERQPIVKAQLSAGGQAYTKGRNRQDRGAGRKIDVAATFAADTRA